MAEATSSLEIIVISEEMSILKKSLQFKNTSLDANTLACHCWEINFRTTWVSTHKTRSGLLAHVAVDRLECGHQGSGDAEHVPDEPGVQHDLERGIRNGVAKPDPHV